MRIERWVMRNLLRKATMIALRPFKTKEIITIREFHGLGWNHPDYSGRDTVYPVYSIFGVRLVLAAAARNSANSLIKAVEWFDKLGLRGNGERTRIVLQHAKDRRRSSLCDGCDGGCSECWCREASCN